MCVREEEPAPLSSVLELKSQEEVFSLSSPLDCDLDSLSCGDLVFLGEDSVDAISSSSSSSSSSSPPCTVCDSCTDQSKTVNIYTEYGQFLKNTWTNPLHLLDGHLRFTVA